MRTHPFPGCFVCGPNRAPGDGLRIFPGMVAASDAVAALWTPDATLCDARGRVAPEFLWAALDCPSAFPLLESEASRALEPMVLAKLCVALDGEPPAARRRVWSWPIAQEGKRERLARRSTARREPRRPRTRSGCRLCFSCLGL
jgi:hypothetical protein